MKFSFMTNVLEWLTLEETIDQLAVIGYQACGPICGPGGHLDPEAMGDSQRRSLVNYANDRNMAFSILNPWHVGNFVAGVASGDTERFYSSAIELAADVGALGVRFLPGSFKDGERPGWQAMIQVLKPLCYRAEQAGVDLLMHNHENQLIDTANGFALLRHHVGSERLKINLDCANLAILMDDPCRAIRDFRDHIRHVRFKGMNDYYPVGQQCVPGSAGDIVDWAAIMAVLKEIGFSGYVELVPYDWFPRDFPETGFKWASELAERTPPP